MGKKHVRTIIGRYEKIKDICKFIANGAEQSGLDAAAVFHVELACDEACTNIIEHAYGAEDVGQIEVSWQVEGDKFKVIIHDNGRTFNLNNVPIPPIARNPPTPSNIDNLKVGGLGIHFMRKLMDEVHFNPDRKGNTLVMIKKISKGSEK